MNLFKQKIPAQGGDFFIRISEIQTRTGSLVAADL